ncbi:hypothetical protein J4437_03300 [Candidatus Woesearchaeota archaeon]|nr:hypothetical protein [Candidatus Woesearchaeota archaeon]
MLKRGQITIFIIIGIIVLFVVLGIFFFLQKINTGGLGVEEDKQINVDNTDSLKIFVEHCQENTAKEGLKFLAEHGGYYQVPEPSMSISFLSASSKIPYYFYQESKNFPTLEQIQTELEVYLADQLPVCLDNFKVFEKEGWKIESGAISPEVKFKDSVLLKLNYPLQISKGESQQSKDNFQGRVNFNFLEIYDIINKTVAEQEEHLNYVPIGWISAASLQNNFTFELSYPDSEIDAVVYSFNFKEHIIDDEPYHFVFANKYDWTELQQGRGIREEVVSEDGTQSSGKLDYQQIVEDQRCYVEDICSYNLNIYNDPYQFEDYSPLFDISKDGRISFRPQDKDVGVHQILVKVSDAFGEEKYLNFKLEIKTLGGISESE